MATITLPKTSPDSKTVLFFSGGRSSKFLADKLKELNGSVENVIAVFLPLTAISTIKYSTNSIEVNKAKLQLQEEYTKFKLAAADYDFHKVIEFLTYEDFDFENKDNLIGDRGRLGNIYWLLNLILEKNKELTNIETMVIGINNESKHPNLTHDVDGLFAEERVFLPFANMTKEEVNALIS